MGGIKISTTGKLGEVTKRLRQYVKVVNNTELFEKYAKIGLEALKNNTPVDTGVTRDSWSYTITKEKTNKGTRIIIRYLNSSMAITKTGYKIPIVILLQYGHFSRQKGRRTWIEGRDFINPSLKPVFDEMIFEIANELKDT